LTNLPETVSAVAIAEIYRKRWTIETQFQLLTVSLHCEVPGLGPVLDPAALLIV
jgi:IS4 transposase